MIARGRTAGSMDASSNVQGLFLPEELESIRLSDLRQKRHQLQEKLKLVSNRINFRKKQQEHQLRQYIRSEDRTRILSQTQQCRRTNEMIKDQHGQKQHFQIIKKAKQVEEFRTTHSRRLQLISQSVKDRKIMESDKMRQLKKNDKEVLTSVRQASYAEAKERYEEMQKMKQRQASKRKYFWLEKRITFQQHLAEETHVYEKQVQEYQRKIKKLRENQEDLRVKEEHAAEVLRCAEQNYHLLRQV